MCDGGECFGQCVMHDGKSLCPAVPPPTHHPNRNPCWDSTKALYLSPLPSLPVPPCFRPEDRLLPCQVGVVEEGNMLALFCYLLFSFPLSFIFISCCLTLSRTHTHTCTHKHTPTNIHTHKHTPTHTHTYMHTYIHTNIYTCADTYTQPTE